MFYSNLKCNDFLVTSPKSYEGMHHKDGLQNAFIWQSHHLQFTILSKYIIFRKSYDNFPAKKAMEQCDSNVCLAIFFHFATTNGTFFLNKASIFGKILVFLWNQKQMYQCFCNICRYEVFSHSHWQTRILPQEDTIAVNHIDGKNK